MKKLLFTLGLMSVVLCGELKAQDPEFTQYYANPLYLNPAFAGTSAGPRFALNFRNQWPRVSGSFVTASASYDEHFDAIGGGIGAQIMYDRAGDGNLTTTYFSGVYSYQLTINDDREDFFVIKGGLQAGAFQRSIDFDKLHFGDEIHPRWGFFYPTQEKIPARSDWSTRLIPDFSAGLLAFSRKYYGGFAVHHIVEPTQSFLGNPFSVLPRKYTVHAGMLLPVDKWKRTPETFISPNILYQRQANFQQVNLGAYLIKNFFVAGLWYRHSAPNADAMMALIGVKKDAVKIGYSYDLTLSDARSAAPGSHEVSLIVELQKYDRRKKRQWHNLSCPDF